MRLALRLGAVAGALALVGGAAALVGASVGRIHDPAPAHGHREMGSGEPHGRAHDAAPAVGGLSVAEDGLRLQVVRAPAVAGERGVLRFRILAPGGRPERRFEPEQGGVPLHLIVVRRDMTGFQHLHPTLRADGTWEVALRLAEGGSYRAFADFTVGGTPRTLGVDLAASGGFRPRTLPPPVRAARAGGLRIRLDARNVAAGRRAEIGFQVTGAGGRPVALQPYLGAGGHLVALREGDLGYLHVHPDAGAGAPGRIAFGATFPSAVRYRLFLQFKRAGRVRLAPFTLAVGQ